MSRAHSMQNIYVKLSSPICSFSRLLARCMAIEVIGAMSMSVWSVGICAATIALAKWWVATDGHFA